MQRYKPDKTVATVSPSQMDEENQKILQNFCEAWAVMEARKQEQEAEAAEAQAVAEAQAAAEAEREAERKRGAVVSAAEPVKNQTRLRTRFGDGLVHRRREELRRKQLAAKNNKARQSKARQIARLQLVQAIGKINVDDDAVDASQEDAIARLVTQAQATVQATVLACESGEGGVVAAVAAVANAAEAADAAAAAAIRTAYLNRYFKDIFDIFASLNRNLDSAHPTFASNACLVCGVSGTAAGALSHIFGAVFLCVVAVCGPLAWVMDDEKRLAVILLSDLALVRPGGLRSNEDACKEPYMMRQDLPRGSRQRGNQSDHTRLVHKVLQDHLSLVIPPATDEAKGVTVGHSRACGSNAMWVILSAALASATPPIVLTPSRQGLDLEILLQTHHLRTVQPLLERAFGRILFGCETRATDAAQAWSDDRYFRPSLV